MLQEIISDFRNNSVWELLFVLMLTIITRIIRMTIGKKMTPKHEIMFWCGCIICGTVALSVVNVGVIKPIQDKFTTKQNPNFHCQIINGALVKSTDGNNQVVLTVKIVNSGSQSIAWKWHINLELATGQTFEADASEKPSVISAENGGPVIFPASTYLPNILLESPISNGSAKKGWVGFSIKDISPEDTERIGNKFTISFQDSEGHITEASETIRKKVVDDLLFGSLAQ